MKFGTFATTWWAILFILFDLENRAVLLPWGRWFRWRESGPGGRLLGHSCFSQSL